MERYIKRTPNGYQFICEDGTPMKMQDKDDAILTSMIVIIAFCLFFNDGPLFINLHPITMLFTCLYIYNIKIIDGILTDSQIKVLYVLSMLQIIGIVLFFSCSVKIHIILLFADFLPTFIAMTVISSIQRIKQIHTD